MKSVTDYLWFDTRDATLDAAVARMTAAARAEGKKRLVMTPRQWTNMTAQAISAPPNTPEIGYIIIRW